MTESELLAAAIVLAEASIKTARGDPTREAMPLSSERCRTVRREARRLRAMIVDQTAALTLQDVFSTKEGEEERAAAAAALQRERAASAAAAVKESALDA